MATSRMRGEGRGGEERRAMKLRGEVYYLVLASNPGLTRPDFISQLWRKIFSKAAR